MFNGLTDKLLGIVSDLVNWAFETFMKPFRELPSLKKLVFGISEDEKALVWGTFRASDLTDGLAPMFNTMAILGGFVFVALIVVYGISIAGAPINPMQRNQIIDFIKDLLFVGIVLLNLPPLYDLLFSINSSIVNLFNGAYESNLDSLFDDVDPDDEEAGKAIASSILGWIFIQLILLGLTLWASFYYLMRKVTLLILMALGPLMIVFWLSPRFKSMTGSWFKELLGSIFIQSIHSFVFWTIAIISASSTGFIETVIVYVIFIPISESIRRLMNMGGDMQGGFAKAGAMMGMAGLAGMYGATKGALDGKSVMGSLKGAYEGIKDKKINGATGDPASDDLKSTMGANVGGDLGTSTKAEKMLRAGDIVGRGGKAVFGMAGAIAGSGLGPVGAMAGASGGFALGGVAGGLAGRTGAATVQGIGDRFGKGLKGAKDYKSKLAEEGLDNSILNTAADNETSSWANANRESTMDNLRQRFPDASESDIASKFNDIQASKRQGFYDNAKSNLQSAKQGIADTNKVNASAAAMTNSWASGNKEAFMDDYDKNHPQEEGESLPAYNSRKQNAYSKKKADVLQGLKSAGHDFVAGNQGSSSKDIASHMGSVAKGITGATNVDSLEASGLKAMSHVSGAVGKPDIEALATGMATAKTKQMRNSYVDTQFSKGISKNDAEQDWDTNHQPKAHAKNLASYSGSVAKATEGLNGSVSSGLAKTIGQASAFTLGATGISTGISAISAGSRSAVAEANVVFDGSQKGLKGIVGFAKATGSTARAGFAGALTDMSGGDVIEAQSNYQKSAGYGTGVIFGTGGYQKARSLASKYTPLTQAVQSQIHSPGEVMQMAQTTTDNNGNVQIAPGAIRQVTTAGESYIEVTTKTGNKQIVSRKGSGHSGMRKGDVVYQDLAMDGDSLVASSPSTYRVDSAGGRTASTVEVTNNPSTLLGNARTGNTHKAMAQQQAPVYSQAVDSGQFYSNDLQAQGFENIEVVVEKNRQFVTGQKDGTTYRVSQVFSGDSRLQGSETVNIPVQVSSGGLQPTHTDASGVVVSSNITLGDSTESRSYPYYSTKSTQGLIDDLDELVPSKYSNRANRSLEQRRALDAVRRKQGLLG